MNLRYLRKLTCSSAACRQASLWTRCLVTCYHSDLSRFLPTTSNPEQTKFGHPHVIHNEKTPDSAQHLHFELMLYASSRESRPPLPPLCLFFVNISFVTWQTSLQCCIICILACMLTNTIVWWKVLYKSVSNYCKTQLPWVLEQYESGESYRWMEFDTIKCICDKMKSWQPRNLCMAMKWISVSCCRLSLGSDLTIYHHPHSAPSRVLNCEMKTWVSWSGTSESLNSLVTTWRAGI